MKAAAKIWLATWTPENYPFPDVGDTRKIKEFMRLKYNDMKWFRATTHPPIESPVTKSTGHPKFETISISPSKENGGSLINFLGDNGEKKVVNNIQNNSSKSVAVDLLALDDLFSPTKNSPINAVSPNNNKTFSNNNLNFSNNHFEGNKSKHQVSFTNNAAPLQSFSKPSYSNLEGLFVDTPTTVSTTESKPFSSFPGFTSPTSSVAPFNISLHQKDSTERTNKNNFGNNFGNFSNLPSSSQSNSNLANITDLFSLDIVPSHNPSLKPAEFIGTQQSSILTSPQTIANHSNFATNINSSMSKQQDFFGAQPQAVVSAEKNFALSKEVNKFGSPQSSNNNITSAPHFAVDYSAFNEIKFEEEKKPINSTGGFPEKPKAPSLRDLSNNSSNSNSPQTEKKSLTDSNNNHSRFNNNNAYSITSPDMKNMHFTATNFANFPEEKVGFGIELPNKEVDFGDFNSSFSSGLKIQSPSKNLNADISEFGAFSAFHSTNGTDFDSNPWN
ncbi:ArfGAP with FG repeats 1 [Clydaea vesicula]|uniref:ArfGAP with FG repeats 1 n=1 Tax=Clydaea vesicula TaxID=447962 RepID=A0AAD5U9M2_9FUNG|nr:ArfGAP with FG repeats 1 [Clydaea vesicula]